jgi:hypothetical protein
VAKDGGPIGWVFGEEVVEVLGDAGEEAEITCRVVMRLSCKEKTRPRPGPYYLNFCKRGP